MKSLRNPDKDKNQIKLISKVKFSSYLLTLFLNENLTSSPHFSSLAVQRALEFLTGKDLIKFIEILRKFNEMI